MRMLVISDDMTGALDTAVKLSNRNMSVLVQVNPNKLSKENIEKYDVIVIDSDSRHMDPLSASKKIRFILEGFKEYKPEYIYKKTDSALRGNIGSELTTLLDFSESKELHLYQPIRLEEEYYRWNSHRWSSAIGLFLPRTL